MTFKWFLYLPLVGAAAVMAIPAAVLFALSTDDDCFYPMAWASPEHSGSTEMEMTK